MASGLKVFVPIGSREYAKLHGVSLRTAERHVSGLRGAVKGVGSRWVAPIRASTYAHWAGISASTARRKGVRFASEEEFKESVKSTLRIRAARAWEKQLKTQSTKRDPDLDTIERRLAYATRAQLRRLENNPPMLSDMFDPEWIGSDDTTVLFYH